MTVEEMLVFSGGVLGPALIAQAMAHLVQGVPELAPWVVKPADDGVDRLLASALPHGLEL